MADVGFGADVVVNGVNYGPSSGTSSPKVGTWSSPTAVKAGGAGATSSTALVVTLWMVLAIEVLAIVIARRAMRRHHGG